MRSSTLLPIRFFRILFTLTLGLMLSFQSSRHLNQNNDPNDKESIVNEISGKMDVRITPEDTDDQKMGMLLLDKTYHGALSGTGKGRMLTGMTDVKESAGYVAIERITGTLKGAKGSFLIQHSGISNQGEKSLTIQIIPDSGSGQLAGIEGSMQIDMNEGDHVYKLKYTLPEQSDQKRTKR